MSTAGDLLERGHDHDRQWGSARSSAAGVVWAGGVECSGGMAAVAVTGVWWSLRPRLQTPLQGFVSLGLVSDGAEG